MLWETIFLGFGLITVKFKPMESHSGCFVLISWNMNRPLLIAAFSVFGFYLTGCDEEKPNIIFTVPEKPLLDTTYIASVPAAQDKHVFIADITGVGCNNCPDAAKIAKAIQENYAPGRVQVLALYPYVTNPPGALTRPHSGYDTLNTWEADNYLAAFGSITGLPTGMVDQGKTGGSYFVPMTTLAGLADNRIKESTPLNIDLKSTWQPAFNRARLEVKLSYHKSLDTSVKHQVYIAIAENGIVGKQANRDTSGGYQYYYKFNHVFRRFLTPVSGVRLAAVLEPGRVFEKHYYVAPNAKWKADNLTAMVWVVNTADRQVLQSAEVELK